MSNCYNLLPNSFHCRGNKGIIRKRQWTSFDMYGNIETPKLQSTFQYHCTSKNRLVLQRTIADSFNICCIHLSMYSVCPRTECPDGFYGEDCGEKCECENKGRCDHQTGRCTCTPGWRGRTCTKREYCTFFSFFNNLLLNFIDKQVFH